MQTTTWQKNVRTLACLVHMDVNQREILLSVFVELDTAYKTTSTVVQVFTALVMYVH